MLLLLLGVRGRDDDDDDDEMMVVAAVGGQWLLALGVLLLFPWLMWVGGWMA